MRNAHERLCAIEDASIADFNYFQNLWRNREGGSMWGPPVPWQEWERLQREYDVAFFKMEKAMFEREVLATELDNHASTIAKLQFALPKQLGPFT